jgi:hypothetical protein
MRTLNDPKSSPFTVPFTYPVAVLQKEKFQVTHVEALFMCSLVSYPAPSFVSAQIRKNPWRNSQKLAKMASSTAVWAEKESSE